MKLGAKGMKKQVNSNAINNIIPKAEKSLIEIIFGSIDPKKIFAIILILALAAADVFAMVELFGKLNASDSERRVYGLTFAVCLEGLPTFLGLCFSKLKDHTNYKKNDYINAKIGTIVGSGGMFLAFAMVIGLRLLVIHGNGGYEAFKNHQYAEGSTLTYDPSLNGSFIVDLFLMFSPIITSFLAFITSWVIFPSDNHAQLEREIDVLYIDYLNKQCEFDISRNRLEVERMNIWKDIAGNDTDMPRSINAFRKESYGRIRNLLIRDCVEKYPNQIERYNNSLKGKLDCILKEMGEYTTQKVEFDEIKIDDIIKQYDEEISKELKNQKTGRDKSDYWEYSVAKETLINNLKKLLNNAIAIAQYKSSYEQHNKKGRKW